jgi:hypothetical protein
MTDLPITILRITEMTKLDANQRPQQVVSVAWKAGEHGPFTHEFPRQGFDPIAARHTIEGFAQQLALMIPK